MILVQLQSIRTRQQILLELLQNYSETSTSGTFYYLNTIWWNLSPTKSASRRHVVMTAYYFRTDRSLVEMSSTTSMTSTTSSGLSSNHNRTIFSTQEWKCSCAFRNTRNAQFSCSPHSKPTSLQKIANMLGHFNRNKKGIWLEFWNCSSGAQCGLCRCR